MNILWAQDEDEDWGRWRDVVFRAKGRLTPCGIKFQPPPPQNRRKRGGPASLKDSSKLAQEEMLPEAGALAQVVAQPNSGDEPASELEPPIQLTTSEALSKICSMSTYSDLNLNPPAGTDINIKTESTSTPATNDMTYCPECYLPLHPDPKPERLYIFLHALRYTTSMGCFETDMPEWAAEGWEWDRS